VPLAWKRPLPCVSHKAHLKKIATNIYYKQFVMAISHAEGAESEVHPTEFFAKKSTAILKSFLLFLVFMLIYFVGSSKTPLPEEPGGGVLSGEANRNTSSYLAEEPSKDLA
jgi:hypothetical protein